MPTELTTRRVRALSVDLVEHDPESADPHFVTWANEQLDHERELHPWNAERVDFLSWKYRRQLPPDLRPEFNARDLSRRIDALHTWKSGLRVKEPAGPLVGEAVGLFELGLRARPRGRPAPYWNLAVSAELRGLFGALDEVAFENLLEQYSAFRDRPWWTNAHRARTVGSVLGWAGALGLVEEVSSPRRWRLLHREMQWGAVAGRARRIRGLTPAEEAALDRIRRRSERSRSERDLRHAGSLEAPLTEAFGRLLEADPHHHVPEAWAEFVAADVLERWPTVREAYGILLQQHREWPTQRQKSWLRLVRATASRVASEAAAPPTPDDALALARVS